MNNRKAGEAVFAVKFLYFQVFDTCNCTMYTTCIITCRIKGFKALKIQEFIKDRNVKYGTVTQYIKRHGDVFKEHVGRSKGKVELDDFAVAELDKIYPFPKPVEVIEDC